MPIDDVTEIVPHDKVLLIAVLKRTLNAASTETLTDNVLAAAAERPGVTIVLDLHRVRFAPSVALGSLVQLSKSFTLDGRRVSLIGVDPRVQEAINVTRLHKVLEIHNTLEDVLATGA